jgi:outer membrane protein OmpA-like peptidoglycan-associated protein
VKYLTVIYTVATALTISGCATKNFVRKNIDPVSGKVEEQRAALDQTNQSLQKTNQNLDTTNTNLNATNERATSADARAGDALNRAGEADRKAIDAGNKADQAGQKAEQVGQTLGKEVGDVRTQLGAIDDYKKVTSATVNFKFNSDKLDMESRQQLDVLAQSKGKYKRYMISVEGFTDRIGDAAYNAALSRRRADAVVAYLVSQHDIPVYRIQMVGLGEAKPVDEGRTAAARAKNRRVEVAIFSADSGTVGEESPNQK